MALKLPRPYLSGNPKAHIQTTRRLASLLDKKDVYNWLVTRAYYPEEYVLPPCFEVTVAHRFGTPIHGKRKTGYAPPICDLLTIQFPKSEWTDRKFSVMDPGIHSAIAYWIASNWKTVLGRMMPPKNKVCSYSFPIPLSSKTPSKVGRLRSGRSIYEFIEMAENDLSSIAYRYKFLFRTDVKNFYPSIYTHSIAWAIHNKSVARRRRRDFSLVGNRLDKLFQNSNDGCTNGIAIGPAVSDVISELILSRVDLKISSELDDKEAVVVRFKDDYRILCRSEQSGRKILKALQAALKEYNLELNDAKTEKHVLPDGLFRKWKSLYHAVNPDPSAFYHFGRFKETYLEVIEIDKTCPNTGVIDRFLVDIVKRDGSPNFEIKSHTLPRIVSLLLMLGRLRTKAFPKVLGILEMVLKREDRPDVEAVITKHLGGLLEEICAHEDDNCYLILWIIYFLRSNGLATMPLTGKKFKNVFARSVMTSRNHIFKDKTQFRLFTPVKAVAKKKCLLDHLAVFKPQEQT
jgi:hypothetical protein